MFLKKKKFKESTLFRNPNPQGYNKVYISGKEEHLKWLVCFYLFVGPIENNNGQADINKNYYTDGFQNDSITLDPLLPEEETKDEDNPGFGT